MRIAVLCNDRVALPAIDQLLAARLLVAMGMPDRVQEIQLVVRQRCDHYQVPLRLFSRKELKEQLLLWLEEYEPDVVLIKTFPFLIPPEVISKPRHGFVNFHYAPLPEWRGPNPLFWMIRNQAGMGGVTVHRVNKAFDEGPILMQQPVQCLPDTNFGLFYTQLAYAGANLTGPLLFALQDGSLEEKKQDSSKAKWYNRPQPTDLFINWDTMTAAEIKALVQACNPWNKGAATRWKGWPFGIVYASVEENETPVTADPGTILSIDKQHGLTIATVDKKVISAQVTYCEEGFYPGYHLNIFGLKTYDRLT